MRRLPLHTASAMTASSKHGHAEKIEKTKLFQDLKIFISHPVSLDMIDFNFNNNQIIRTAFLVNFH